MTLFVRDCCYTERRLRVWQQRRTSLKFDRLLALVFLLQRYPHLTARELAARLQVSERTLYRDINDLSLAGVPIYGEGGPGGGYTLLPDYHLHIAGLNEEELSTLFSLKAKDR
ncbi:helix-turn-helix transcriptional regulator [Ktedonobacter robiniae]|uniref:helix-turn-helix transcriptional regulator n=1 Tax=Ktedonobacter robiniae TaxID=2778365 RepID=UPI001915334B|nr:HTH domain-containing protein [Ktedonobacter robiniae]